MSEKHHSETAGVYETHRKPPTQGKGDKRRPGNVDAYREGWDRIFGKKRNAQTIPDSKQ